VKGTADACKAYALDPFFTALARAENGKGVARVSHYGDSLVADELISARLRSRMQDAYGDGGPGFVYVAKPHPYYRRKHIDHKVTGGWLARTVVHSKVADGMYGVGAALFEASGKGARATFKTVKKGNGSAYAHIEAWWLKLPKGGKMELSVDGKLVAELDGAGERKASAWHELDVADGAHTVELRAAGGGRVRAFGVVLERKSGVVWECVGLISGSVRSMIGQLDEAHWAEQLKRRKADLIVLEYGANEANYTANTKKGIAHYEQQWTTLLGRVRAARPDAACLVIATMDSASIETGKPVLREVVGPMVEAQRRAAAAAGCAFFDTYAYMGGRGSIIKWRKANLAEGDYLHLRYTGAHKVADAIVDALIARYGEWKQR
jgi:lysophospholipase L1-like esterase